MADIYKINNVDIDDIDSINNTSISNIDKVNNVTVSGLTAITAYKSRNSCGYMQL